MSATARPARARRAVEALEGRLDTSPHHPRPSTWTCQGCPGDVAWPCDPARVRLAEAYPSDRVGLSMFMGDLLAAALTEMPNTPPDELFERFIHWTH